MIVFNHETAKIWSNRYRYLCSSKGKTNGAYTYSQEINKHHIPLIENLFKNKNVVVFTVDHSFHYQIKDKPLIITYLHESLKAEQSRINQCLARHKTKHIWITGRYRDSLVIKQKYGPCIFLPISIDTDYVKKFDSKQPRFTDRIIFFGNTYYNKGATIPFLHKFFKTQHIKFDTIINNVYTAEGHPPLPVTREAILSILSHYNYGIGSGKCFLEMNALGLKTLISGEKFCGLITNEREFDIQTKTNFCASQEAGIISYSPQIKKCWDNIDNAYIKTIDSKDVLPILESKLKKYL